MVKPIGLVGIHQKGDGLGRLAESDRQDAGGQGVEGARMAGLLGVERPPHPADGLGGAQVQRLVQAHPAGDGVALAFAAHQASGSSGEFGASISRRTRGSSSRRSM